MLSERLRQLRKTRGLTQEDLAKKVNTKKTTISNYETGYSTPSNEMLSDLADVLNTTTDYLLGRTKDYSSTRVKEGTIVYVAGKEIDLGPKGLDLGPEALKLFERLKKNPILFHQLAEAPENRLKLALKLAATIEKDALEDDDDDDDIIDD